MNTNKLLKLTIRSSDNYGLRVPLGMLYSVVGRPREALCINGPYLVSLVRPEGMTSDYIRNFEIALGAGKIPPLKEEEVRAFDIVHADQVGEYSRAERFLGSNANRVSFPKNDNICNIELPSIIVEAWGAMTQCRVG